VIKIGDFMSESLSSQQQVGATTTSTIYAQKWRKPALSSALVQDLHFIQLILVVKYVQSPICSRWEGELYRFIHSYIQAKGHCAICVNGTDDHVHILLSIAGQYDRARFVQELKQTTAEFINANLVAEQPYFDWHKGYGYHNYHHSLVYEQITKIKNQKELHLANDFKQEYHGMLKANTMKHQLDA
jgi:putative transposase